MFESLFTRFELTDAEVRQIDALHTEFEAECAKHGGTEDFDKFPRQLFADMAKKVSAIRDKAHSRALKYYATHTDELISALKEEAIYCACEMFRLEDKSNSTSLEEYFKHQAVNAISFYSELLPPVAKSELLAFVDDAFKNREKLYKERKKALEPKKADLLSVMFSGMGVNALARVKTRGKTDGISKTIKVDGVNIFSPDSVKKIGVGATKIFRYAVAEFTKHNSQDAEERNIHYTVLLDVKDFAEANGVNVSSESTMKQFRLKLRQQLETLRQSGVSFVERIKGKETICGGLNYIGKYEMHGNSLSIEFTVSMANYLVQLPQIQYPRTLYKLDNQDYNAFAMGEGMCIHYSNDNNVIQKTENKLKVSTLLGYTSFPDREELRQNRWSWKNCVKEPFEQALDKLTQCGFLGDWVYCVEGGRELTDKEASEIIDKNYDYFVSLVVKYEINDFPAHQRRAVAIAKKQAEKAKLEKAKKAYRRKAKQSSETDKGTPSTEPDNDTPVPDDGGKSTPVGG